MQCTRREIQLHCDIDIGVISRQTLSCLSLVALHPSSLRICKGAVCGFEGSERFYGFD
jgi:hypothetical protein